MRYVGRWRTGEDWLRRQEMTQRINPLKQGYRQILVPATGVFWSTVWSTIRTPASAVHPYWVTMYVPAPRLGFFGSFNFVECVSKVTVDSFAYMERGDCLYILVQGFLKGTVRLRFASKDLAAMVIDLV